MLDGVFDVLQWKDGQEEALDLAEFRYTSWVAGTSATTCVRLKPKDPSCRPGSSRWLARRTPRHSAGWFWRPRRRAERRTGSGPLRRPEPRPVPRGALGVGTRSAKRGRARGRFGHPGQPSASTTRHCAMAECASSTILDPAARELAIGRLASAMRGIDATDGGVASIVRRDTLVVNVS